ncbi:SIR2 family protein [Vibrio diabolicus]|uniref:SIR2 family protein n=1 Tax=Vibrio diabolicus TaxID=50719 RepID=UPI002878A349|nr:hypothetical protein [Vibrio parahaemolyticus]EIA1793635.1 SIR2 family protein [Vibrio parahaemolyticus]ELF4876157.1 SIR2 family protein [Vibrio parahaemolyticus]
MAVTIHWDKISQETLKEISKSTFKKYIDSYDLDSAFHKTTEDKLKEISSWYRSEKLVIALGAGASVDYGLPDWNTLLQKLLLISLQTEATSDYGNTSVLAKTFSSVFEPSALISARYLHNHFKKTQPKATLAFENAIRDSLYDEVVTEGDSELLKEVRQYCIAAGRSPNLNSIITYNYDDLLEKCLSNIDVDIPFTPIHSSGMRHKEHELPIYHVHGYLPQNGQLTSKNKVVLSEDGYHQQYTDIYGWSNLTQINKFKEYNCLFIGLSFSDPNLRRILDIAMKERGENGIHHYCFKKRYSKKQVASKLNKLITETQEVELEVHDFELADISNDLVKLMEQFDENDALSFGIGVIWVDSYSDIPEHLKTIRTMV